MRLELSRLIKDVGSFRCGNASIEEQIKGSYYATLLREGYAYEILLHRKNGDTVCAGYCMLKVVTLREDEIPEAERDYSSSVYDRRPLERAAVEITYLAIDEELQNKKIGTATLNALVSKIEKLSEALPVRYIVIHSLSNKVLFYQNRGFQLLQKPDEIGETQFMYMDCLSEKQRETLDAYIKSCEE